MTKAHSSLGDNFGMCELCNDPKTEYQTYPVLLGGGLGWGTMWLCPKCLASNARDRSSGGGSGSGG